MEKKIYFLFILLFNITFISSVTLNDVIIRSNGLNSTINVSNFSISFDELVVDKNYIEFYNLSYTNPLSCDSKSSFYSFYNYTNTNEIIELYPENCSTSGGGGSPSKEKIPLEEKKESSTLFGLDLRVWIVIWILLLISAILILIMIVDILRKRRN